MGDRYLYLAVDILSIAVPFLVSFLPIFNFKKEWYRLFPAIAITAAFFLVWDAIFNHLGVWGFNDRYILGKRLFGLPLEEYMFFICIPYASIFVHFIATDFLNKDPFASFEKYITPVFVFLCLGMTIVYHYNYYTGYTFGFLSLFLILCWLKKIKLSRVYFSYLFVLFFFFITNGILTGAITPEPVVWYDDNENLGIRLITIPIEDTFYGFLLIAMNATIYELLDKKR